MGLSPRQVAAPARDAVLTAVAAAAVTAAGTLVGPRTGRVAAVGALGGIGGLTLWFARDARRRLARIERRQKQDSTSGPRLRESVITLSSAVGTLRGAIAESRQHVAGTINGEHKQMIKAIQNETRQLEGLLQLQRILPLSAPIPATRGWAASPDLLLAYVQEILRSRPELVVECGSGVSTLYSALALEVVGASGKVVAIDHDPDYAEKTRAILRDHGVSHRAEVRVAPIQMLTLEGEQRPWYDVSALEGLDKIGLLFVDGPLGSLHHESRYPALALLREHLLPGTAVFLDDSDREGETAVVEHWRARYPELEVAKLQTEKGTVLLRVPR